MDIHLGLQWWIFDPNPALRVQVRTASKFVHRLFASAGSGKPGWKVMHFDNYSHILSSDTVHYYNSAATVSTLQWVAWLESYVF